MMTQHQNELTVALLDLAIRAGEKILEIYDGPAFSAAEKADGSPVTAADAAAEAVILEGLAQWAPAIPVLAEEAVEAGHLPEIQDRYFLVDPLDGTKEFIKRNGEFTVNIALISGGKPVFGVVYAPVLGDIYWGGALPGDLAGAKGANGAASAAAFMAKVEGGKISGTTPLAVRQVPPAGLSVLASRSHLSPETAEFIEKFEIAEQLSVGSSLKLCWLAAGRADLYPRLAPTMQWDIAAGDAVLRAAGGALLEAEGWHPRHYTVPERPSKPDLVNPSFVAVSSVGVLQAAGIDCPL